MGKDQNTNWGKIGEGIAAALLENKGYKIIERNFHAKSGEIDIISKLKKWWIFVEVKLKKEEDFGDPLEMIQDWKKKRLLKTAQWYLLEKGCDPEKTDWRVDAIGILFKKDGSKEINHVENAVFKQEGLWNMK